MKPVRATVHLCAAVDDDEAAMSELWDRIDAAIAAIPGVFNEGGGMQEMDLGDVIDGSPLALALNAGPRP